MTIPVGLLMAITMLLTLCVVAVVACIAITARNAENTRKAFGRATKALEQAERLCQITAELQRRAEAIETRLSNFHKGLNSTNERFAKAMEDMDQLDTELRDTLNHFEHRLNHLHNSQSALCHELGVQLPELPKAPEARVLTP
ncbi:MAG: hypothetical protein ACRCXB_23020 [Aeromonadaceae bacterium]